MMHLFAAITSNGHTAERLHDHLSSNEANETNKGSSNVETINQSGDIDGQTKPQKYVLEWVEEERCIEYNEST